jgi:ATP adenylyltransferase
VVDGLDTLERALQRGLVLAGTAGDGDHVVRPASVRTSGLVEVQLLEPLRRQGRGERRPLERVDRPTPLCRPRLSRRRGSVRAVTRQLWAPWRLEYIQSADEQPGCFFCAAAAAGPAEDEANLVVHRGARAIVLLNRYPYSSAHMLVAPLRHDTGFDGLDDAEALEVHRLARSALATLAAVYRPDGANLGWNLGRVAGAGVADHVHLHVVPRWNGDTSFMPVLADVKVMPEHLLETRRRLAAAWSDGSGASIPA